MAHKFFIAGTDTGVGKTYVSVALIKAFNKLGLSTIGLKPVASGGFIRDGKIYNTDALALQEHASISLPYEQINPFSYLPAVSPNIADNNINVNNMLAKLRPALNYPADVYIIEGVGGWHAPLNSKETMADFVIQCKLPVILVVGIKLGCLNHAILTARDIGRSRLKGWIANCIDPEMLEKERNIETLRQYIQAPCLGIIPFPI